MDLCDADAIVMETYGSSRRYIRQTDRGFEDPAVAESMVMRSVLQGDVDEFRAMSRNAYAGILMQNAYTVSSCSRFQFAVVL